MLILRNFSILCSKNAAKLLYYFEICKKKRNFARFFLTSMQKGLEKTNFWHTNIGFVTINLLSAAGAIIILLTILYFWLSRYTMHGVEVEVPQVSGLTLEEAQVLLSGNNLNMQVVDSTYSNRVPLGTIVDQNPPAMSKAKPGRTIYLVVNAKQRRQVGVPMLLDMSYRQAMTTLSKLGLNIDTIIYEPSAYRDLVLDLRQGEVSVPAGTQLYEGTALTLVVGQGLGTETVVVPDLTGRTLEDARSQLLNMHLTLGTIDYDIQPAETGDELYVVYLQNPHGGSELKEGQSVSVHLSKNLEKAAMMNNQTEEEDFF